MSSILPIGAGLYVAVLNGACDSSVITFRIVKVRNNWCFLSMFGLPNFVDFVGSIKQRNINILTTISCIKHLIQEFEDAKGVIRICKPKKNRQDKRATEKMTKGQTMIYKTYT